MRTISFLSVGAGASTKTLVGGLAIAAFLLASTGGAVLLPKSTFTTSPPTIDGTVGTSEWAAAGTWPFPHGIIYLENDSSNLYVLFDMTGDTTLDTTLPNFDYFRIGLDVNGNGIGDPGSDVFYTPCSDGTLSSKSTLIDPGPCSTTPCQKTTAEVVARGFGSSPASATNHVIFEVAIPFSEIQAKPGKTLGISFAYQSFTPSFYDYIPSNPCDYLHYLPLQLGEPPIPALGRTGLILLALLLAGISLWVLRRPPAI